MSDHIEQKSSIEAVQIPLNWTVSKDVIARYATNLVVQRLENEYLISFFEVKPPILLGSPEEVSEKAKNVDYVEAICIAQIFIAAEKMPEFVKALQENLTRTYHSTENK